MPTTQIVFTVDPLTAARFDEAWSHLGKQRKLLVECVDEVGGFSIPAEVTVSGLELLSAVGRACTHPDDASAPSALFALLRYAWAVADSEHLALADDIERLDSHRKAVLSDEFGCGVALLFAERFLATPLLMDVESGIDQGSLKTRHARSRRPDYFGKTCETTPRVLILEAKGTQGPVRRGKKQVKSGCDQLRKVKLAGSWSGMPTVRTVVATCLRRASESQVSKTLVGDPSGSGQFEYHLQDGLERSISRAHYGRLATLTGDRELAARMRHTEAMVGLDLVRRRFAQRDYLGTTMEVRGPEVTLRAFAGLAEDRRGQVLQSDGDLSLDSRSSDTTSPGRESNQSTHTAAVSGDGFVVILSRDKSV